MRASLHSSRLMGPALFGAAVFSGLLLSACSSAEDDDDVDRAGAGGASAGTSAGSAGASAGANGSAGSAGSMAPTAGASAGAAGTSAGSAGSAGNAGTSAGAAGTDSTGDGGMPLDGSSRDGSIGDLDAAVIDGLPTSPVGFASVDALGRDGTTGGAGGAVMQANSGAELIELAARDEPLIIEVRGTIDAPRVEVASNKTILGIDGATLRGGLRVRGDSASEQVSNVIIQNLLIDGRSSDVDGDAMHIYYAHHVWVDHCEFFDGPDGNLDIVHASDYVTVSFTKFRYSASAPDEAHRFSNLIGHDDPNDEDIGKLKVTFHHNHWAERVHERMPRVRYGDVHVFSNLFTSTGNNYAIRAGFEASILIENNYFDGVGTPHEIDGDGASVVAEGNVYDGTNGAQDEAGDAFDPPYDYTLEPADDVPTIVLANVGPR